ncbi:hypothetical protein BAE44_0009574 [Dichanthelium oligosanthes]|uniref:Uncharacterized protein n=1 Tax=Dichanthelium oligosanthes TaxID=888268 RepID=A0A1E5VWB5_9POAL|nr:hypothetical protein BAE44_0009574 [Dichanthelium oligosanthes]
MAAARRLFSFQLGLHPGAPARPLAAVATPHCRDKHDAVACKATGKAKSKSKSKAKAGKGGERLQRRPLEEHLKRRTRSAAAFDADLYGRHGHAHHVPVLLGEVLAAFRRPRPLRSFVDCTLGAAGHSLAVRVPRSLSCSIAFVAVTSGATARSVFMECSCLQDV